MRSALSAWCAILLWFAFSWGVPAAARAQDSRDTPEPPQVQLSGPAEMALAGRSIYWVDESGSMRVEQVEATFEQHPWQLRRREVQNGGSGALWIVFDAVASQGPPWYVEVTASVSDRVELYYRDRNGAWVRQMAGSALPLSQWAVPGRLPTFALAPDPGRLVRYWLRVEDTGPHLVAPLTLLRADTLQAQREQEQFVLGAYFGLIALVAIAALVNGTAFRDRAFLAFALYIVLLGLGQLARGGLGAQHFWPEVTAWNAGAHALWPGAAIAAALWMVKILTDPARLSGLLDLAVWGLIAALLGATALHMTVDTRLSELLVLALTGLGLVAVLGMVLWGWLANEERHLGIAAAALFPAVALALFPLARAMGLAPANLLTRFGLYFGSVLQLPLLYYAINTRLMTRRDAQLRASALSRTDPLTGLPHRRALVERLDSSLNHARAQKQSCALLCIRLWNIEEIAGELGRDAADKALVITASHLRRLSVGYDMAARVGDREFALLLEAPVTREAAISRAQQVVASGLRQAPVLPGATLRYHVTWTVLPRPQLDGAASLEWVAAGLDQITPEQRKAIRALDLEENAAA